VSLARAEAREGFLTAAEVARTLGVSRTTAYRLMREMGRVRVGRAIRVSRVAFDAWLASHTEPRRKAPAKRRADDRQMSLFGR
jgi:excisionase family DNA binding protein